MYQYKNNQIAQIEYQGLFLLLQAILPERVNAGLINDDTFKLAMHWFQIQFFGRFGKKK